MVAALTSEADFVFIPEDPAPVDWPEKLCKKLLQVSHMNFKFSNILRLSSVNKQTIIKSTELKLIYKVTALVVDQNKNSGLVIF